MAIKDNLKNGGRKALYDALQYSGFVNEDMTFDEMCAVLKQKFPESYEILYDLLSVETDHSATMLERYDFTSETYDITGASTLSIDVDATCVTGGYFYDVFEVYVGISKENSGAFEKEVLAWSAKDANNANVTLTKYENVEIDVNDLVGEYYVGIRLKRYSENSGGDCSKPMKMTCGIDVFRRLI